MEIQKRACKNVGLVSFSRQDIIHSILSVSRSRPDLIFSSTRWETNRTTHKPITDKPYQAMTSRTDKPIGLEYSLPRLDWIIPGVEIKPTQNKPPLAVINHYLSLQRSQLCIRKTFYRRLGYFSFFIEFNILFSS